MTSKSTTATPPERLWQPGDVPIVPSPKLRSCERCGQPVAQSVSFMGETIEMRYCAPCAEAVYDEEEAAMRQREVDLRLERAGGTARLREFSWEQATRPEVGRRWLERYAAGERRNLILDGSVGAGKTGLAWLIIAELCGRGTSALFLNFRDLLWDIKRSFNTSDGASLLAVRAQTVPVLALDDLGAERPTAWACEELATLVDRRYEARRATIVTSNYSPAEVAKRLGQDDPIIGSRIISRLVEGAEIVKFDQADRRLG